MSLLLSLFSLIVLLMVALWAGRVIWNLLKIALLLALLGLLYFSVSRFCSLDVPPGADSNSFHHFICR